MTADVLQIVTAVAFIAGVVSFVVGFIDPMTALIVALLALAGSIAANVYLLRKVARWRDMSAFWSKQVRRNLDREIERLKPKEPETSAWLPDPKNLDSLTLTTADLDRAYAKAEAEARETVGPDAHVWFTSLALMPLQCAYFEAHSVGAEVAATIFVSPEPNNYPVWTHDLKRQRNGTMRIDPPWRLDSTWRDLIRLSWQRERHPGDGVTLFPHTPTQEGESGWLVCYRRSTGYIKEDPRCYVLRNGVLVLLN